MGAVQTGSLKTHDGLTLFVRCWLPETDARAAIIVSHGYAEHSGRYEALASTLTGRGYAVYALDHRGHGRSEGERANVAVFRAYVDDLARFIERVREKDPRPPRFLLGHSMGGMIALQLVLEHPEKVEGVAVSAAFIENATQVPWFLTRAAGAVSRLAPKLPVQHLDTDALARDKRVVARYRNDPLVYHGKVKARLGAELLQAGPYVLERAPSIRLPLLLMHGTGDRIAAVSGTQRFFERVGSSDKTLKLYDGAFHELFNDYGKEAVQRDVLAWLERQVGEES
ncbi:alpha/beta hydrolase fold protein [Truepera radiovictrix DSM 17093]|uniref:Monoacylglycerol lipase n=1 Tax=Truepera radiovictrix (strain DSM 17093 / CIP 108686 / LMG 22925 / RQ-24) TaxID=649638 RepID=D7CQK2_TRURR|nr:alpha/beta hydrolase [Truepera radiovictrix]ADI14986.1 alpha/beta hydrolase fold protein [Truepera radiovictrix DSM 17093]